MKKTVCFVVSTLLAVLPLAVYSAGHGQSKAESGRRLAELANEFGNTKWDTGTITMENHSEDAVVQIENVPDDRDPGYTGELDQKETVELTVMQEELKQEKNQKSLSSDNQFLTCYIPDGDYTLIHVRPVDTDASLPGSQLLAYHGKLKIFDEERFVSARRDAIPNGWMQCQELIEFEFGKLLKENTIQTRQFDLAQMEHLMQDEYLPSFTHDTLVDWTLLNEPDPCIILTKKDQTNRDGRNVIELEYWQIPIQNNIMVHRIIPIPIPHPLNSNNNHRLISVQNRITKDGTMIVTTPVKTNNEASNNYYLPWFAVTDLSQRGRKKMVSIVPANEGSAIFVNANRRYAVARTDLGTYFFNLETGRMIAPPMPRSNNADWITDELCMIDGTLRSVKQPRWNGGQVPYFVAKQKCLFDPQNNQLISVEPVESEVVDSEYFLPPSLFQCD